MLNPTSSLVKKFSQINGTSFNLTKNNRIVIRKNNCKVSVYPTQHLKEEEYVRKESPFWLKLSTNLDDRSNSSDVSIQIINLTEADQDVVNRMNEISHTESPIISKEYNSFHYFLYDGKPYFYNINEGGFMFTTPINDKYLYWVMVANYTDLTKEDIESILYFE